MARRLLFVSLLALAMAVVACSTSSTPGESTTATATLSTSPGSTGAPPAERPVRLVGCDPTEPEVEIVCETYDLIQRHYVDRVSDQALADAAGRGIEELNGTGAESELTCAAPAAPFGEVCELAADEAEDSGEAAEAMVRGIAAHALDPNSVYLDREALELVEEEQHGEIEGIGALVNAKDVSTGEEAQCSRLSDTCRLYVVSTISGTPAEEAGLERDDVIVEVDGEDVRGRTVDEITAIVRGPAGTEVTLTVDRAGDRFEVEITRAAVTIPVVEGEAIDDVGYVALNLFTEGADERFEEVVEDLLAEDVRALVIDVRDNPGGLLDTAVEIASAFIPDGDVVITESPESSTAYPVTGNLIVPEEVEVVFIVNRGSASASEVVAAVLQERHRVTVVGENTFGKNTVQQRFDLSNGGALKLTIARWLTPGGLDFGEVGVTPDVVREIEAGLPPETVVRLALSASLTVGAPAQPSG